MSASLTSRQSLAWAGVLVLLVGTAWFGWRALRAVQPANEGTGGGGRPPSTVIYRPARTEEVVERLSVTGSLRAVRRAEVAAREPAAVESLLVDEGDSVQKNAVIARLDGRRLQAQLLEAEATLTAAEADLAQRQAEHERAKRDEEMMRDLWDERAVAEREYLDSVRELKVAAARENAAEEAIAAAAKRRDLLVVRQDDLEIHAPFDGRVVARHVEIGEWLSEGDPVITLVSIGEVEAWLQLPERHAAALKEATPEAVELRVPGHAEPIRADKISLIPDVEGRSRRFTLIAHVPDPENRLTPGSSVEARVPLGKPARRLVVDSDAVLNSYAGTYVFIPEKNGDGPPLSKRIPVDVLFERSGESILTSEALKEGDQVIVEGNERLFPNTPLDPQPWEETRGGEVAGSDPLER